MKGHENSKHLYEEAIKLMPGGVSSPVRACKGLLPHPLYFVKGKGPFLYDADGNRFIDLCCVWGANIIGHSHPSVVKNVRETVRKGLHFGSCHPFEIQLSKKIIEMYGGIEQVRFVNSGTEATMSAIRLARAVTSRSLILKFEGCYHGHADYFLVKAGSGVAYLPQATSPGIPDKILSSTRVLPLNDIDSLEKLFRKEGERIACAIIEPIPANMGIIPPSIDFLTRLRQLCTEYGALLILDEVITGFRVARGGASAILHLKGDIICFGKVTGGGMPVGAYASSSAIMSHVAPAGTVYQAGTLSGNPVALSAGISQLTVIDGISDFYTTLKNNTLFLGSEIHNILQEKGINATVIYDYTGMLWIGFGLTHKPRNSDDIRKVNMALFRSFYLHMLNSGIYMPPSPYEVLFLTIAHSRPILEYICKSVRKWEPSRTH